MDIKKYLYYLPPKVTSRVVAFTLALILSLVALRIASTVDEPTEDLPQTEDTQPNEENNGNDVPEAENDTIKTDAAVPIAGIISASEAVLFDFTQSSVLAEKNMYDQINIGDLSIFMTAIITSKAINDGVINLDDYAVCPASAAKLDGYSLSSEVLPIGKRMKVGDILKCMIYQRGSAYVYTLAVHIGKSEEAFVDKMNEYAVSIGLKNTVFTASTSNDLHTATTTPYDLAIVLKCFFSDPILKEIFCSFEPINISDLNTSSIQLVVKNEFFEFYCTEAQARADGILGGKVSCVNGSGWSVVVFGQDNIDFVSLIIGSRSPFSDALMVYSAYALQ